MFFFIIFFLQTNTQSNITSASIWTIIAGICAIISAYSAYRSRGFAKRNYELASKSYSDRQSNFDLYLVDSYRWVSDNAEKKKFLLFHITIHNKSDSKNSFKGELEIEYLRNDNSISRVIVSHNESYLPEIPQNNISSFPNDIRIEEKAMQSKWLIFEQPTNLFKGYRIEKYEIKVSDIQGNIKSVESALIKELSNEN